MATVEQLSAALVKADAAGNVEDARALAAEIRRMREAAPTSEAKDDSFTGRLKDEAGKLGNLVAGAVRGAGSMGATLVDSARSNADQILSAVPQGMRPNVTSGLQDAPRGQQLRADMTRSLESAGADPNSVQFQAGKIGTEVLGSMGAGGAVANGARLIPGVAKLAPSIASGGFTTGMAPGAVNWLTRLAGGSINGGAMAGLVDPEQAPTGAMLGGALPAVAGVAGYAGNAIRSGMEGASQRLMQSAIKPTIKQLKSGDANTAVNVLLEKGISPNEAGVNKLRALIDDIDNQIGTKIAGSTARIDKQAVLNRLADTERGFANQVSPTADLAAIRGVGDDFMAHPSFPLPQTSIPIQQAQDLKRGTYQVLSKKYGQVGAADVEAQKALARGLKEEIATAVPEVQGLNADLSKLITTMDVAERRALMELNKNPMGLAALAQSPASWGAFMADRSAAFKAIAARMINSAAGGTGSAVGLLGNSAANPVIRNALVRPLTSEATP
jgi:hypothetical protein